MSIKENDAITEYWTEVYDQNPELQELMYSIVLNNGWCSNYDDVDQMYSKGYEMFISDPQRYIAKTKETYE